MTTVTSSVKPAGASAAAAAKPIDAVRRIAKEIARPHAAEVDQKRVFPWRRSRRSKSKSS